MKKSLLITLLFLAGCASEYRQVFKARQTFDKYPNQAAKYCGDKFPVTDSLIAISVDTAKGRSFEHDPPLISMGLLLDSAKEILNRKQNLIGTLSNQLRYSKQQIASAEAIIARLSALKANNKPCRVDTIKKTFEKLRANTAKIMALTEQIVLDRQEQEKYQNSLRTEKAKSTKRLYIIIAMGLFFASVLGFKAYEIFTGKTIINNLFPQ